VPWFTVLNALLLQGHFALRLLAYWYCNLTLSVRWHNAVSGGFGLKNGDRQGGILSPFLFRFYIKDVVLKLTSIGYGCNIGGIFVYLLCYADDMVLITPSWSALQGMLNVLESGDRSCSY